MRQNKQVKPALNRKILGRFVKGQSGNPAGRPRGVPDKRTELRALLEPSKKLLINKVVSLALKGDPSAMRLCIERLIPALRPTSELIQVDISPGSLGEEAASIFKAASRGQLPVEEATKLMELLIGRLRIKEVDLEERIMQLEERVLKTKGGD